MPTIPADPATRLLERLRIELTELAFMLECQGRRDAADVANTASARVAEICDELAQPEGPAIARNATVRSWSHRT